MNRASNVAIATVLLLAAFSSADEGKEKLPDLPVAASSLGAVECDGFLYVYGGHMAPPVICWVTPEPTTVPLSALAGTRIIYPTRPSVCDAPRVRCRLLCR
jgi:hypothetical protein